MGAGPVPASRALAAPAVAGLLLLLATAAAPAAEVTLHAVRFQERASVAIPFAATVRAPSDATLDGEGRVEGNRTRLSLSWKRMRPALLFGGEITSYVAWAVAKDGATENLGELFVKEAKGSATFATDRTEFGLLVTAEPHPGVAHPSGVVVFTGGAPKPGKADSVPFAFGRFSAEARPASPSIASLEWTSREPVELAQARVLLSLAEKAKSGDPDQKTLREAREAFARAETPSRGGGAAAADEARRSSALASEALVEVARRRAAEEAARLEAARVAKEAARKAQAADEADRRRQSEALLAEVEELRLKTAQDLENARQSALAMAVSRARLEEEREQLLAEKARLKGERDARLGAALESVAPTAESARGRVVSLPGSSFDTGGAALKPSARLAVGKLAGILLMVPELNVRIEGYTDSTGNSATNRKLSEARARQVADLLREQGVGDERVVFEGYGSLNPVAPNATAEGRARNRRVEVILAEGEVEAAPREAAAPPR